MAASRELDDILSSTYFFFLFQTAYRRLRTIDSRVASEHFQYYKKRKYRCNITVHDAQKYPIFTRNAGDPLIARTPFGGITPARQMLTYSLFAGFLLRLPIFFHRALIGVFVVSLSVFLCFVGLLFFWFLLTLCGFLLNWRLSDNFLHLSHQVLH